MAIPHNSKCRYGKRGAAAAKLKAQIILDAAKVSAASGGCSEPKQGQRSQSARGFCPRSTMRVPQPDIIEHFGNADAVPQPPERCLSRKAGIVRCCLISLFFVCPLFAAHFCGNAVAQAAESDRGNAQKRCNIAVIDHIYHAGILLAEPFEPLGRVPPGSGSRRGTDRSCPT